MALRVAVKQVRRYSDGWMDRCCHCDAKGIEGGVCSLPFYPIRSVRTRSLRAPRRDLRIRPSDDNGRLLKHRRASLVSDWPLILSLSLDTYYLRTSLSRTLCCLLCRRFANSLGCCNKLVRPLSKPSFPTMCSRLQPRMSPRWILVCAWHLKRWWAVRRRRSECGLMLDRDTRLLKTMVPHTF